MRSRRVLIVGGLVGALLAPMAASAQTYSNLILSENPLFYWNFNEAGDTDAAIDQVGTDAGDNLLAEGNATRVPSTTTTSGLFLGRAASFDGTQFTKFFSGALTPATNPDAWAVEMWIRPQGPDPGLRSDYLLEAHGGGSNVPGILFDYAGGSNDVIEVFRGARTGAAGPVTPNDAWHHLVIGYFGVSNDRVDFYRNGAAAGTVPGFAGDIPFGTDAIAVGNSVPGHPEFDAFQGQIDELAIYDLTGLSVTDISSKLTALASHYSAVPEPAGAVLLMLAAPLFGGLRRR